MPKFVAELIKILAGVLIEKGLKPFVEYLKKRGELAKKKKENKKKIEKLKRAENETDFDDGFDNMP